MSGSPLMIIECKAAGIGVTGEVFDQVARYNLPFGVPYLVVTNGLAHYCCRRDAAAGNWTFLDEFPDFDALSADVGGHFPQSPSWRNE